MRPLFTNALLLAIEHGMIDVVRCLVEEKRVDVQHWLTLTESESPEERLPSAEL